MSGGSRAKPIRKSRSKMSHPSGRPIPVLRSLGDFIVSRYYSYVGP
jgi:hypothetical protein